MKGERVLTGERVSKRQLAAHRHPDPGVKRFPFFDDEIILASSSPRRSFLLGLVRIKHKVVVPRVREEDHAHEDPVKHVLRLAGLKAHSARGRVKRGIILGADTIVVMEGDILGKPRNKRDAKRMLRRLSGQWHTVYTGLAVVDAANGMETMGYERSLVKIRKMTDVEIDAYIATGEPMDKAGSYGIQGYGAAIVEKVRGCYFNVVGLPLVKLLYLVRALKKTSERQAGAVGRGAAHRRLSGRSTRGGERKVGGARMGMRGARRGDLGPSSR